RPGAASFVADDFIIITCKRFQNYIVAVTLRIGKIPDPVPQVNITTVIFQTIINGQVSMPEYEKIEKLLIQHLIGKNDQPFLILTEENFFRSTRLCPASPAHIISQHHPQSGGQN